ncbi:MAG: bifunctional nuclease family protein [Armatimonadota bacterium]|nr:MAG: bifunctional nuclease family protein [Armatimonadota bacterium]
MEEVPVKVWRVGRNSDSQYLLVLQGDSEQALPMVIGPCEAMAIWSVLQEEGEAPRRPMTHDLLRDLIARLGGRVVKVVIDDLWNGVYYAKLHIAVDGEVVTVDARPSDAVAVALRTDAPLFATDSVLAAASEPETRDEDRGAGPEIERDLGDL